MTTTDGHLDRSHAEKAAWCDQESRSVEASLRASAELERQQRALDSLTCLCVEYYEDFRLWAEGVKGSWREDPSTFDEDSLSTINNLSQRWFEIFARMVAHIDACSVQHPKIEKSDRLADLFTTMMSIRMMDDMPMPAHMRQLAEQARADRDAGLAEEF